MRNRTEQPASEINYKIASRSDELWGAFKLIYLAYVQRGLALPNHAGLRVTPFHVLQTTEVVIGSTIDEVICTATIVHDGSMGLPLECVYAAEVAQRRAQGITLAEVSCLADRTEPTARSFPVLCRLMSLIAQSSKRRGADELLIAVHPRHARFYHRYLGFRQIGEERTYPSVRNHPALALSLDLNNLASQHPGAHERLFGSPFPVFTLERPRISNTVWDEIRDLVHSTTRVAEAQTA
jgi:hypothetical protein